MIHKWSWGIAWILFGISAVGIAFPYLGVIMGIAFIVSGIAFIFGL
jgi:hypothetical protein